MGNFTRRDVMKAVAAASALQLSGQSALAADPLKVAFIFIGPVGDYGWTWAHNKGRLDLEKALGNKVKTTYVENVKEDASAIPILRDLARQGNKLIFACSFNYMEQVLEVAREFPEVKFEHCTGFKRAPNVATYSARFHEGRAVIGTIAGYMSKSGVIGYLGSFKIPEVVMGVNAFTLAAQAVNPKIQTKLVMIDTWFDPAKETAATQTLANLGCDVITTHTDSPAPLQFCEQKGIYGFGQGADMSKFAPKAQLTAIEDIWAPHYIKRANAVINGTWKSEDFWEGIKAGDVVISPYNPIVPKNVQEAANKIIDGYKNETYDIFKGPIFDQNGTEKVSAGKAMSLGELATIDWYVKGVQSA